MKVSTTSLFIAAIPTITCGTKVTEPGGSGTESISVDLSEATRDATDRINVDALLNEQSSASAKTDSIETELEAGGEEFSYGDKKRLKSLIEKRAMSKATLEDIQELKRLQSKRTANFYAKNPKEVLEELKRRQMRKNAIDFLTKHVRLIKL